VLEFIRSSEIYRHLEDSVDSLDDVAGAFNVCYWHKADIDFDLWGKRAGTPFVRVKRSTWPGSRLARHCPTATLTCPE
jgi:hypothetical protein